MSPPLNNVYPRVFQPVSVKHVRLWKCSEGEVWLIDPTNRVILQKGVNLRGAYGGVLVVGKIKGITGEPGQQRFEKFGFHSEKEHDERCDQSRNKSVGEKANILDHGCSVQGINGGREKLWGNLRQLEREKFSRIAPNPSNLKCIAPPLSTISTLDFTWQAEPAFIKEFTQLKRNDVNKIIARSWFSRNILWHMPELEFLKASGTRTKDF